MQAKVMKQFLVVCPRLIYGEWWIHMKEPLTYLLVDRVGPFNWVDVQVESERLIGLGHQREQ